MGLAAGSKHPCGTMRVATNEQRRTLEAKSRPDIEASQLERLQTLLAEILPHNRFYAEKLGREKLPVADLAAFEKLPETYKDELITSSKANLAANLTYDLEQYVRFHQTSGTKGRPLRVLDTPRDWAWWIEAWQFVLDAAEVTPTDRIYLAFSFGPFIGFWSAFDAAAARGCMVVPGGGLNTLARLEAMNAIDATVLLCTPSYALHLAEVAAEHQIDVAKFDVRRIIVAGEPGGNVPALKERIERTWNAKVVDHAGASEIGPWGYADELGRGLYINESEFIAEFRSVDTGEPAGAGELAELLLTSLGRSGFPIIRYRTGDLVRPVWNHGGRSNFVLLDGGVLGRVDDMVIVRGVNVYPSAIEQIVRGFPEVTEYRLVAFKQAEMDQLRIEVEDRLDNPQRIAEELRLRLGLRIEVTQVPIGSLPRFELKGKRFVDER